MEPGPVVAAGFALGILYSAVAVRMDRLRWEPARKHAQDFYVLGWWALAASAFLSAADSALVWAGATDLAVSATLRLGVVLAFVLAAASLLAAAGHTMTASASVKAPRPRQRTS